MDLSFLSDPDQIRNPVLRILNLMANYIVGSGQIRIRILPEPFCGYSKVQVVKIIKYYKKFFFCEISLHF